MQKTISLFLILLVLPSLVFAEGKILTLDEAISGVMAANPDIHAAHYRTEAARARIPQARSLEDPMVGVMFDEVPIDSLNVQRGDDVNYRIEQKLPFPGKRYTRGKVALFEAQAVQESSQGQVQDVLLDLKRTYYDLYRLDRSLEVNRENQKLVKQFLGSAETWYATGQTTANTPLRAQVELSNLKNQEILLDQEKITHMAHLKALLNRDTHEEIRLPSKLNWPRLTANLETIISQGIAKRPELAALRAMQKRDKVKLTTAKQTLLPDFSLGFEYNQKPDRQDAWTGTVLMNLPIFFWSKNRGAIQEARASFKATQSEHESMEIHTHHEIEQAYSAVKAYWKLLESYQNGILPQAKVTLESSQLAYTARKIDFLTLVEAARTYRDLQMSYFENQARYGTAYAALERLVGMDLKEENSYE